MGNELLPCPFCGGRQTYRKHDGGVLLTATNHKRGCIMRDALPFVTFNTEAEAIEAWNTRAERTCKVVKASRKYVLSDGTELFEDGCSECNGYLDEDDNFCPNCGGKVVD